MNKKIVSLLMALLMLAAFVPYEGANWQTVSAANASSAKSALQITSQPLSVTAKNNAWVTFSVSASGVGISYQWQLSDNQGKTWRNSSIKAATYGTTLTTANNGRYLRCVVTDRYGNSVNSNVAVMKITTLKITTNPTNANVLKGATATFKVAATGSDLTYQWQLSDDQGKTWRNSKATSATYSATVTDANNGRYVRCVITDRYGNSVKSGAAIMKIATLKITAQPANQTVKKGAVASFKVAATGNTLTYKWQLSDDQGKTWRNSKITSAVYSATVTDANNGRYVRCIVTDKFGNSLNSNVASMKISGTTTGSTTAPTTAPTTTTSTTVTTTTTVSEANSIVWVTSGGKKYHSNPTCSGMKNPVQKTVLQAKAEGYTPCHKCY